MFEAELDTSDQNEITFMISPINEENNQFFLTLNKDEYDNVIKI